MKRFTKSGSASDVAKGFCQGAQLRIGAKYQIDPAGGPFHGPCGPIAAFKAGFVTRNIDPFCAHIEQVDKKVVAQGFRTIGEDTFFGAMAIGSKTRSPPTSAVISGALSVNSWARSTSSSSAETLKFRF